MQEPDMYPLEDRGEISFSTIQKPIFIYSTKKVEHPDKLQVFLNQFDGIALRVDGWLGKKTSSAVKELFGHYLQKDPRE